MNVVCFAGYSGVGKTTLLVQLIAQLRQRGLRVSVLKHAHAGFDMDKPGKDTYRHREAGASEVLVASGQRLALLREFEADAQPSVHELLAELDARVDWVLVEGFRDSDLPKVEVWRAALDRPPRYPHDGCVRAVATDDPTTLPGPCALPLLDLAQPAAVADWLLAQAPAFAYPQPSA